MESQRPQSRDRRTPVVGLIGPAGVGKSTIIWKLDDALETCDWNCTKKDTTTSDPLYAERNLAAVTQLHFPPKTAVSGRYDSRVISVKRKATKFEREGADFELKMFDPAGELLDPNYASKNPNARDAYVKGRTDLLAELADCDAFVILLDPTQSVDALSVTWANTFDFIQKQSKVLVENRLRGRTAVMFAKADELPWQRRHRLRQADDWVAKLMPKFNEQVRRNCWVPRFFFCSTAGWVRGMPNVGAVVRPRTLDVGRISELNASGDINVLRGDLVPDPPIADESAPLALSDAAVNRQLYRFPVFSDPLRFANRPVDGRHFLGAKSPIGVVTMPGRDAVLADAAAGEYGDGAWRPWNLAEPILWTIGQWDVDAHCPVAGRLPEAAISMDGEFA